MRIPVAVTYKAGAIILAGGQSRRMGQNKSLLPYRGAPLIQHIAGLLKPLFPQILISTNEPDAFAFLGLETVPDLEPDQGPLMGIASALRRARYPWNLVVATDMPDPPVAQLPELFARTLEAQCVVARTPAGRVQPLFGLYHRELEGEILGLLAGGEHRVMHFIKTCRAAMVEVPEGAIRNLNTLEQYGPHEV